MLIEERRSYISALLKKQNSVTVKELSDAFNVSEVTVRKQLEQMEKEDLLRRTWGGAVLPSTATQEFSYVEKEKWHLEEKCAIAETAYALLKEGETVFIDCGTTSFQLIKCIVEGPKKLTVCTNAFNILSELRNRPDLHPIMIGGELRPGIFSCVGTLAIQMLKMLVFDRAFITGDHFSLQHGFTVAMPQDAEMKRAIQLSAKRSYVIMDSSKYGEDSLAIFAEPNDKVSLITDWRLPEPEYKEFERCGVSVLLAPKCSERKTEFTNAKGDEEV